MKKSFMKVALVSTLLLTAAFSVQAQAVAPAAEPYWVVESNLAVKKLAIIRFYNEQHQLVYEEKLEGVQFDFTKKKNRRMLDKALAGYMQNSILGMLSKK